MPMLTFSDGTRCLFYVNHFSMVHLFYLIDD
uniref:Uncharacterized protein n=1 Tax=Arundo donax TaxID=35708 RepID=A0A0A8YMP0_ARUDO